MNAGSAKLRWTKKMPHVDGLYWHRDGPANNKHLVWIETVDGKRMVNFLDGDGSLKPPAEWAGPILVPEPED